MYQLFDYLFFIFIFWILEDGTGKGFNELGWAMGRVPVVWGFYRMGL